MPRILHLQLCESINRFRAGTEARSCSLMRVQIQLNFSLKSNQKLNGLGMHRGPKNGHYKTYITIYIDYFFFHGAPLNKTIHYN